MQVFYTSMTRINRGEAPGDPRPEPTALRAIRPVGPDPFIHIFRLDVLRSVLVRSGIATLD